MGPFGGDLEFRRLWKGNLCNELRRNRQTITETKQTVETHKYSQEVASLTDDGKKHLFKQRTKCQLLLKQSTKKKQRPE